MICCEPTANQSSVRKLSMLEKDWNVNNDPCRASLPLALHVLSMLESDVMGCLNTSILRPVNCSLRRLPSIAVKSLAARVTTACPVPCSGYMARGNCFVFGLRLATSLCWQQKFMEFYGSVSLRRCVTVAALGLQYSLRLLHEYDIRLHLRQLPCLLLRQDAVALKHHLHSKLHLQKCSNFIVAIRAHREEVRLFLGGTIH